MSQFSEALQQQNEAFCSQNPSLEDVRRRCILHALDRIENAKPADAKRILELNLNADGHAAPFSLQMMQAIDALHFDRPGLAWGILIEVILP